MGRPRSDSAACHSILVVGTLDTKGDEIRFLRDRLTAAGVTPTVVDIGVLGMPAFQPDVPREEIARAAGESIAELVEAADRGRATAAMHNGFAAWVCERRKQGLREGMLAIVGSAGTAIATSGMRELPIGAPAGGEPGTWGDVGTEVERSEGSCRSASATSRHFGDRPNR
jgi:uncharacterized protein (UPF0261 family)